jgi:hypothetical protein
MVVEARPVSRRGPTTAQVLLGLFIVWQLFFLFSANFLSMANYMRENQKRKKFNKVLPGDWKAVTNRLAPGWLEEKGHLYEALDLLTKVTDRWAQLTNQPQNWQLFAPGISKDVSFLAVEFRWDEVPGSPQTVARPLAPLGANNALQAVALLAPAREQPAAYPAELVPSENQPGNLRRFFRWGKFRLRKYESHLEVDLSPEPGETPAQTAHRLRDSINEKVGKYWDNMLAYLRIRLRDYMANHPDRPRPTQVILWARQYIIPSPESYDTKWYVPRFQLPIARWQPGTSSDSSGYPIEAAVPEVRNNQVVHGYFEAMKK